MRIYLIGFMGAGKSTLGPLLAKKLKYSCLETDSLTESLTGMTIPEIFRIHGEARFRELEKQVLYYTQLCKNTVICTGGGTPCYAENMKWMKQQGLTVYLYCSDEVILRRLTTHQKERPLFTGKDEILKLLNARIDSYKNAHLHINNNEKPNESVEAILQELYNLKE